MTWFVWVFFLLVADTKAILLALKISLRASFLLHLLIQVFSSISLRFYSHLPDSFIMDSLASHVVLIPNLIDVFLARHNRP